MNIKAIDTEYKGYLFRSRLEARWAVFFDELGIEWEYEKEGFKNDEGDYYLPDFYLPKTKTWVEVKGDKFALQKDWERMTRLLDFGGVLPDFCDSLKTNRGLLLLGDIPDYTKTGVPFHPIIQHHKGLIREWAFFIPNEGIRIVNRNDYLIFLLIANGSDINDFITEDNLECGPNNGWIVKSNFIETSKYGFKSFDAYRKAKQARFEHRNK